MGASTLLLEYQLEDDIVGVGARHTSLVFNGLVNGGQAALKLSIVGILLQTSFVGIMGGNEVALSVQSCTFTTISFSPVRLDLSGLLSILQGIVPFLLGSVGSRAVAVENVVFGLEGNSLGELVAVSKLAKYQIIRVDLG